MKKRKMKKKIIIIIITICALVALVVGGFAILNRNKVPLEKFVDRQWYANYDSRMEELCFYKEMSFLYYDTDGNPIYESNFYESYSYNERTGVITMTSRHGMPPKTVKVISCKDHTLVLEFDGEQKTFIDNLSKEEKDRWGIQ